MSITGGGVDDGCGGGVSGQKGSLFPGSLYLKREGVILDNQTKVIDNQTTLINEQRTVTVKQSVTMKPSVTHTHSLRNVDFYPPHIHEESYRLFHVS